MTTDQTELDQAIAYLEDSIADLYDRINTTDPELIEPIRANRSLDGLRQAILRGLDVADLYQSLIRRAAC